MGVALSLQQAKDNKLRNRMKLPLGPFHAEMDGAQMRGKRGKHLR